MTIDPQLADWYARLGREFGPLPDPLPATRRKRYEDITTLLQVPAPASVTVRDLTLPLAGRNLAARLYHPGGGAREGGGTGADDKAGSAAHVAASDSAGGSAGGKPGLLVFYHGGGWVTGSLQTHHGLCLGVAAQSGVAVVSVDYRLAPEHAYPAPCEDAYDALVWLAAHADELGCDARRIAVGGDSAGAHLAAVAAITARDRGGPKMALQWLIYPTVEPDFSLPSQIAFAAGPGLTGADMDWFWRQFLGGSLECPDHRASPARAASLAGLPPAYVLVAELDPLRDEGERYAARLREAGVAVTCERAAGMTHGFARLFPVCEAAALHMDGAAAALKEGLA